MEEEVRITRGSGRDEKYKTNQEKKYLGVISPL